MAGSAISIDIGGFKYLVDNSNETIKTLTGQAVTTAGTTLHDIIDNTNYQVPAGKTFKAIGCIITGWGSNKTLHLIQNDTADSKVTVVEKFIIIDDGVATDPREIPMTHLPTIAAEKFVNAYVSNTTAAINFFYVIGVEF